MNSVRSYRMVARAHSVQRTQQRILGAAQALLRERLSTDIRLEDVAERSGVTVQTVLRRFGTREQLIQAAFELEKARMLTQRDQATPGDVDGSIAALVHHYEDDGDMVVRRLAEQHRDPRLAEVMAMGRDVHRRWVLAQFGPQIGSRPRRALVDALVAACDVYAWSLLRRDLGRTRREVEAVMGLTVRSLLGAG
jgi:AcrR family transcriptional regulator